MHGNYATAHQRAAMLWDWIRAGYAATRPQWDWRAMELETSDLPQKDF